MNKDWENISDIVMHWAKTKPKRPAIIEGPHVITWKALADHVRSAAVELRQRGLGEDSVIGITLGNSAELVILFLAALRLGAIPMVISTRSNTEALRAVAQRFKLAAMFVEATPNVDIAPITINLMPGWRPPAAPADADPRSKRSADENRTALLSSGSTGEPRAHLSAQSQRLLRAKGRLTGHPNHWSAERPGVLVPGGHLGSAMQQNSLLTQLLIGGPVALAPTSLTPAEMARTLASWDGAICILNPSQCRALLACTVEGQLLLPRAQMLRAGGEMMSADEKRAMVRLVTPNYCENYGAAGFGTIALLQPEEMEAKAHTVGRPRPGVEVQIVDAAGQALPSGEIGRVRLRGASAGEGFLVPGDVDANAPEGYREGWVYPGDLGQIDADGYLILKGRLNDRIVQAGIEVFPTEIEAALMTMEGISEAAVVGRPAPSGDGSEAIAFVVKRSDLPHEQILRHCQSHLSLAKSPRLIFYVDRLPRSPGGKIDRGALRKFAADHKPGAPG